MIPYGTNYHENGEPYREAAELLDAVRAFLVRFVAFPSDAARDAVALWAAHAHLVEGGENSPRLALLSPEPGSGKTRVLEILELLVREPMAVLNASAAPIFRTIEAERPTLLFDEVDAIFGRHGKDDPAEDLRALLNAGHRKGARIPRCVGPKHDVHLFEVYAAVAMAGLGDLPETLMSRSIVVRMRRRAPGEVIESFRRRQHAPAGEALRDQLSAWCGTVAEKVGEAWPVLPDGISDRPADVWEPLIAIADVAGGHWPETARAACKALSKVAANRDASLGVRLLADLRVVFGDGDALHTATILGALHKIEEAPWDDLRGKPLDPRGLARRLGEYGITSVKVNVGGKSLQGYRHDHLWDAWQRYLPPIGEGDDDTGQGDDGTDPPSFAHRPEPPEPAELRWSQGVDEVPDGGQVPEPLSRVEPDPHPLTCDVPQVPEVPELGEEERTRDCETCSDCARLQIYGSDWLCHWHEVAAS